MESNVMDKLDVILWVMSAEFGLMFMLMPIIWNMISKLDEKITDIDRRLWRLEGAFSSKDWCKLSKAG